MLSVAAGVDASQAISGLAQMQAAMAGVGVGIQDASLKMVEWNRRGDEMKTRLEGLTDAGKKFQAVVVQNAKGGMIPTAQSFKIIEPKSTPEKQKNVIQETIEDLAKPAEGVTKGGLLDKIANIGTLQLIKQMFNAIFESIKQGARDALEFQLKISEIRTITQDTALTFQNWSNIIGELSSKFGVDQLEVAAGAYDALSNQVVKATNIVPFMTTALEFARTTGTKTNDAINLLSSTLNSYGESSANAERHAAILFKTIDLGRITANEVANSIGRVTQMAATAGVSLEEVSAGLAALTVAGIKPNEAMTLLTNVMQKLLRPSEDMKRLMESWGTPTFEAANAAFGFAGVLRKVEEAAKGSVTEISNLFNEIRAGRGVQGLTLFGAFEESLEKIRNSSADTYEIAKKITEETPARALIKEFTEIKNFFINDLGQSALANLAKINRAWIDFGDTLKTTVNTVILLGKGYAIYWGYTQAIIGTQTAYLAITKTVALTELELYTLRNSQIPLITRIGYASDLAFNRMMDGAKNLIINYGMLAAKIAAVGAALGLLYLYQEGSSADKLKGSDSINRIIEEKAKATIKATINPSQEANIEYGRNIDAIFKAMMVRNTENMKAAQEKLKELRKDATEFGIELKASFDLGLNRMKDRLRELQEVINSAKRDIKESERSVTNFTEKSEEMIFRRRLQYATDPQARQLLDSRMQELQGSIDELYGKALNTNIDFRERELARQKAQQQIESLRSLAEEQEEVRRKLLQAQFGGQNIGIPGPSDEYLNNIARATQLNIAYEKQWQNSLKETITIFEKLSETQKRKVLETENAAKEFFEFRNKILTGSIGEDKDFKTSTGGLDINKVVAQYQNLQRLLRAKAGDDYQKLLDMEQKFQEDKTKIMALAQGQRTELAIKDDQNKLIKDRDAKKKEFDKAIADQADAATGLFDPQTGKIKELTQDFETARRAVREYLTDMKQWFLVSGQVPTMLGAMLEANPFSNVTGANNVARGMEEGFKGVQRVLNDLQNGKYNLSDPLQLKTVTDRVNDLQRTVPALRVSVQQYLDTLYGSKVDINKIFAPGMEPKDGQAGVTYGDIIRRLESGIGGAKELLNSAAKAGETTNKLTNELQAAIINLPPNLAETFIELTAASANTNQAVGKNFTDLTTMVRGTDQAVVDLKNKLEELRNTPPINIPINIQQNGNPNIMQVPDPNFNPGGFATGGIVYGPRGSDNIPAWLAKGEFVMNPDATKAFYSQLVAMNNSVKPGYYSRGGYVTTNVGDIHMNVTATGNPERDVRDIGNRLRRALKRGTVRLY